MSKIQMSSQLVLRQIKLGATHMTPKAKEGTTLMIRPLKLLILSTGGLRMSSKLTRVQGFSILRPLQRDPQNLIRAIAVTRPLLATIQIQNRRPIGTR